jgi:hypothetical protein
MSATVTDVPPDLTTVAWKPVLGHKGPYERAVNDNSLAYKRLLNRLQRAGGSFDSNSFHVWVFSDGVTIGRRAKIHE